MTVKNAIEILDGYCKQKIELKNGLKDPTKSWNDADLSKQISDLIADSIDTDIIVLQAIQKQIQPNCSHPKKLRDIDSDENTYCMGCNLDL